jgi:hypothetical protein
MTIPYEETKEIAVRLTSEEAVVLFELLSRWTATDNHDTPSSTCFEDRSECAVLHGLLCDLESLLVAQLRDDYEQILSRAREQLAPRWDGANLRE